MSILGDTGNVARIRAAEQFAPKKNEEARKPGRELGRDSKSRAGCVRLKKRIAKVQMQVVDGKREWRVRATM
jgi:hypothetical protein